MSNEKQKMAKKEIIWGIFKVIIVLILLQFVHALDIIYSDNLRFRHTENTEEKIIQYLNLRHYLRISLWIIVFAILIRYFINRIKFHRNQIETKPKLFNWFLLIVLLTELPIYVCYSSIYHSLWFTKFHLH